MKWIVKTLTVVICLCFISYLVGFNSTLNSVKFVKFKYLLRQKQNEEHISNNLDQNPTKFFNKIQEETVNENPDKTNSNGAEKLQNDAKDLAKVAETKEQSKERVENQQPQKQHVPITILYWYQPWDTERNFILSEECGKCVVTDDRSSIDDPSIAAVVFHFNELSYQSLPDTKRNPDQFYVYFALETPSVILHGSHRDLHEYDGYFNWTMTYRRDSDIYVPSSTMSMVMDQIKNNFKHTDDVGISWIMKQKQRLAVWIVSNCDFTRGAEVRLKLVEQMVQAGMDIDRRGKCFPRQSVSPGLRVNRGNEEQMEFMTSSKFYIAFENAHHCKDYITEKLFINAFLVGAVPIVWGAKKEDYEAVVPPHSCIFVDDFAGNCTKLADYIQYLDKNDTAYEEYLHWRMLGYKHQVQSMDIDLSTEDNRIMYKNCILCRKLTMISNRTMDSDVGLLGDRKVVQSLKSWVFDHEEPECMV